MYENNIITMWMGYSKNEVPKNEKQLILIVNWY